MESNNPMAVMDITNERSLNSQDVISAGDSISEQEWSELYEALKTVNETALRVVVTLDRINGLIEDINGDLHLARRLMAPQER